MISNWIRTGVAACVAGATFGITADWGTPAFAADVQPSAAVTVSTSTLTIPPPDSSSVFSCTRKPGCG
jgi:hypothetical protein